MTEAEWLVCNDPKSMLEFVKRQPIAEFIRICASQRKERLFGCACCWQVNDLIVDARCFEAVQAAERLADGLADADDQESY